MHHHHDQHHHHGSPRSCDANGSVIAVVRRLPLDLFRKRLGVVLVGEEDEYTRVILEELLQPTKQAQIVVAGFLRPRKMANEVRKSVYDGNQTCASSTTVFGVVTHAYSSQRVWMGKAVTRVVFTKNHALGLCLKRSSTPEDSI